MSAAVTVPATEVATMRIAPVALAAHIQKARANYEHALLAQEGLLFSAWLNEQYELAERRARKRRMQIAWALLGGPLPKQTRKNDTPN